MNNQLVQLSALTTVVADTGDIEAIVKYQPEDATTNPSLILKAAKLPDYRPLLKQAIIQAKSETLDKNNWVEEAVDRIAVKIGNEILQVIPGRVSTEVDARLSYDTQASIEKARKLIKLYGELGIPSHRILIKLAATWQGIRAAEQLEKEGIQCNLTLLFSFAQARACAEAGVFLISPFVGRILDWHKSKENRDFTANEDPGVKSVKKIFDYYKSHGYETVVMGASFRNVGEILALAGCDKLTISPQLLNELSQSTQVVSKQLSSEVNIQPQPEPMTHAEFLWQHNLDSMAVEKLSEGIRLFAQDQIKLEEMIKKDFG